MFAPRSSRISSLLLPEKGTKTVKARRIVAARRSCRIVNRIFASAVRASSVRGRLEFFYYYFLNDRFIRRSSCKYFVSLIFLAVFCHGKRNFGNRGEFKNNRVEAKTKEILRNLRTTEMGESYFENFQRQINCQGVYYRQESNCFVSVYE